MLVIFNFIFASIRSYASVELSVRSSRLLFVQVLHRVLKAPLSFYQENPVGRLLNRMSGDMDKVDLLLPTYLYDALDNVFILASSFIISAVAVPWMLILFIPIIGSFYFITRMYRTSSRELMRMDAISRSPLNNSFGQTIETRETIRAFRMQGFFRSNFQDLVNRNSRFFLLTNILQRWNSITINLVGTCFIGIFLIVGVLLKDGIPPTILAIGFVYSLRLMGLSSVTIMNLVLFENQLTSVERVQELLTVPQEKPREIKGVDPDPKVWPSQGMLEIRNLRLQYRSDLPMVLNGINLSIRPAEKIGICGRTGSGKSSIMRAILRLYEPESDSKIILDGVDILDIGLGILRSHAITIIPQEPVIYNGTLRDNLDPEKKCDDSLLWEVLNDVQLAGKFKSLDFYVGDGGSLISHGQRQLLVICRAILKKCKVLLVDEATSSVDEATDNIVQNVLRKRFTHCTVLTIAHRLRTIIDSDRILVLESGNVVEFDSPANLLKQENKSIFASMYEKSQLGQK